MNSILTFLVSLSVFCKISVALQFRNTHQLTLGSQLFSSSESNPINIKESLKSNILSKTLTISSGLLASYMIPSTVKAQTTYPVYGPKELMSPKSHGTSDAPVQAKLRWNCDPKLADRICNYNRNWAEFAGYWTTTSFLTEEINSAEPITFYDSVTGKPLFIAPKGRSFQEFKDESMVHGWPSFRDEEVVWENVRCLKDGETVSLTGTHLGHNLPDRRGNRYCINLVSIAGYPTTTTTSNSN